MVPLRLLLLLFLSGIWLLSSFCDKTALASFRSFRRFAKGSNEKQDLGDKTIQKRSLANQRPVKSVRSKPDSEHLE